MFGSSFVVCESLCSSLQGNERRPCTGTGTGTGTREATLARTMLVATGMSASSTSLFSASSSPRVLPPRKEMKCGRSASPLILRTSASLESEMCGVLKADLEIVILEEEVRPTGDVRARVAQDPDLDPLGWVTSVKDGKELLKPSSAAPSPSGYYCTAVGYGGSLKRSPTRTIAWTENVSSPLAAYHLKTTGSLDGFFSAMLGNESMATRIARRRKKRHLGHTASRLSSSPTSSFGLSAATAAPADAPDGISGEPGEASSQGEAPAPAAAAPKTAILGRSW